MSTVKTLDYLAAKTAQNLVEEAKQYYPPRDIETFITKALGVLQAQGVYAMYLFLYSKASPNAPATLTLFYLWNELSNKNVPLPLNVRVAPLQYLNSVLCEPKQVNLDRKTFNAKEEAEEFATLLNYCVKEREFWAMSNGVVPQNLDYTVQQQGNKWKVHANDQSEHQRFTQLPSAREIILTAIRDLTTDLDILLFVRDLYEQTLIYARYHAKAAG